MKAMEYLASVKATGQGRKPSDEVSRIIAAVAAKPGEPVVTKCSAGSRIIKSTGLTKTYTAEERAVNLAGSVRNQLAKVYKLGTFAAVVVNGNEVHAVIDGPDAEAGE